MSASGRPSFLGRTAITGVGYTPLSRDSGMSVHALAVMACRAALDDCGLKPSDVDGIVTYSLLNDSVYGQAVAAGLGSSELTYAVDLSLGGQAPCAAVTMAAMAVDSGMARNVLVFRALNGRSGKRIGSTSYESLTSEFRYPIGFNAYPQYIAIWARRFMIETGFSYEDLGHVVSVQRDYAALNERAMQRKPLSVEDYLATPFIVDPFRKADCTIEVDGACAVLVTSLDEARSHRQPPAVINGAAWTTPKGSGLDHADLFSWPDWSKNCHHYLRERLWKSARATPGDIDFAEIYDCFSMVVPMTLEGHGICPTGGAGEFISSGETRLGGSLPVNTHGGLLCEGYLHGMNTVNEAVLQIQGRGGARQVKKNDCCLVTSAAMMDGSALVLTKDEMQ
ncbi:MAG: acetyl-CoA acetyltransferase [Sphingobium sp.]|uniref:thiolase C-terminal domain-containing protein n=1 Tax=Sphingobium sp. TaxID=1912891 RepID=UPI0029ACEFE2|nr:acetyl-CoA acetyltransferase [Sphingobium sp.]MDX3909578.1 acetyl-CoA acetyltransferase [Sphingobium sp.]